MQWSHSESHAPEQMRVKEVVEEGDDEDDQEVIDAGHQVLQVRERGREGWKGGGGREGEREVRTDGKRRGR